MRHPAPPSSVTTTDGSCRSPSSRRTTEWGPRDGPRTPPAPGSAPATPWRSSPPAARRPPSGGLRVPDVAMQPPPAGGPLPDDDVLDVRRGALTARRLEAERRVAHLARGVTVDVEVDGLQGDVPEAHVLHHGRPQLSDAVLAAHDGAVGRQRHGGPRVQRRESIGILGAHRILEHAIDLADVDQAHGVDSSVAGRPYAVSLLRRRYPLVGV